MKIRHYFATAVGKTSQWLLQTFFKGGSSYPGKIALTLDPNILDYLARDFEHLQINFGCTGGQHRSVYCAEQTAKYIKEKYNIDVQLKHIERELQGQFI